MVEKSVHVFGIPKNISDSSIVEKFKDLLKHQGVKIDKVSIGDRQIIRLTFANLDEKGVEILNSADRMIKIDDRFFPFIVNDEVCQNASLQMPYETWKCVVSEFADQEQALWKETVNGLMLKQRSEDGTWVVSGPIATLTKFDLKCKELLNSKFSPCSASPANSEPSAVSSSAITNQDQLQQQSSVRPKTRPDFIKNDPEKNRNETLTNSLKAENEIEPRNFVDDENRLELLIGKDLKIIVAVGRIEKQKVGAIVNTKFESKTVDGYRGKQSCDENLLKNAKNGFVVGASDYFPAKGLPCKFVIDVCLPSTSPQNETEAENIFVPAIQTCYQNCFLNCKFLELTSIAFQPLGHELFDDAAKYSGAAATQTVFQLIQKDSLAMLKEIRFVCSDERVVRCFVRSFYSLKDLLGPSVDVKILSPTSIVEKEKSTFNGFASTCPSKTEPGLDSSMVVKLSSNKILTGLIDDVEDDKMDTTEPTPPAESAAGNRETCSICLCEFENEKITELPKCKHKFHSACIDRWMDKRSSCPMCQTRYGPPKGNQPPGTIHTRDLPGSVPGYPDAKGWIEISYHIPSGTQGPDHPNPGKKFTGASRVAYLPKNKKGQKIAGLLKLAFEYRITFTVGTSVTTGVQNTVVWNNIHHKTYMHPGPFGYPDDTYLDRVEDELRSAGVDESMLK